MTRDQKLSAISMKMARKYDKEGCQAFSDICGKKDNDGKFLCEYCRRWGGQQREAFEPVMIGDMFDYIETLDGMFLLGSRTYKLGSTIEDIYEKWNKKREPLDKQSDECIDYVFDLIPKNPL